MSCYDFYDCIIRLHDLKDGICLLTVLYQIFPDEVVMLALSSPPESLFECKVMAY